MMDNFHIDLTSEGDLTKPMEIAFRGYKTAEAYAIDGKRLIFFWSSHADSAPKTLTRLPFKIPADAAADFAKRWLAEQDYGREPDHDGDNGKGWRLYTENWGRIGDWWGSIVAIEPAWACYGK